MQLLAVLLVAALAFAAAVPEPTPAKRAEADSGPIFVEAASASSTSMMPLITDAPDPAAIRLNDPDYESSSSCTPKSMCWDGITCGVRYGGCYDKNFCTGTISFPMPTVTCDPAAVAAAGLTQNFKKRMEAAAVE